MGELTKPEFIEIAAKLDLITAEKKDSRTFVSSRKVNGLDFCNKVQPKEGIIVEIPASSYI